MKARVVNAAFSGEPPMKLVNIRRSSQRTGSARASALRGVGAGLNLLEFSRFEIADVAGGVKGQSWMCAVELSGGSDFDLIL